MEKYVPSIIKSHNKAIETEKYTKDNIKHENPELGVLDLY